jgi:Zn-finger nucleic acid-binding protein
MTAETLHCQNCGAAVSSESPLCEHCGARLATISCPSCFGMMFRGLKYCPHCGAVAVPWERGEVEMLCPACQNPMLRGQLKNYTLHECEKCYGIWLDAATFERISRDAEKQAVAVTRAELGQPYVTEAGRVRYRRCPVCQDIMNRINFAHCSGVVVDVCAKHGTWFDKDELQRIVLFIRAGGLDDARARERAALEEERRRLEAARRDKAGLGPAEEDHPRHIGLSSLVGATDGLLGRWLWR